MIRTCHECAGRPGDQAAFLGARKRRGALDRCTDCLAAAARPPPPARAGPIQSRRSARAAWRHRSRMAQLDLVDLLVARP